MEPVNIPPKKAVLEDENIQWNLPVTTTSMIKFITCDLSSNVF